MLQICTKFSVHRVKKQKRKKTEVQAGSLYVLSVVNFTVSLDGELDLHSKRYCVSLWGREGGGERRVVEWGRGLVEFVRLTSSSSSSLFKNTVNTSGINNLI